MRTLVKVAAALSLVAFAAGTVPAEAMSKSYCKKVATTTANSQVGKKTLIGAGGGCVVALIFKAKCGKGALIGGGGGFALSLTQWNRVYNDTYHTCRHS